MHKAHQRLQSWGRRWARAELWVEQRLYIGELPYSPDNSVFAPSTNEGDEDEPTNVTHCPGLVHQPQPGSMVSRRSIMASWQRFWLETFARLVGPIRIPQLAVTTLGTVGSVTGDRWTQRTLLVNIIVTPHLLKAICQFLLQF